MSYGFNGLVKRPRSTEICFRQPFSAPNLSANHTLSPTDPCPYRMDRRAYAETYAHHPATRPAAGPIPS